MDSSDSVCIVNGVEYSAYSFFYGKNRYLNLEMDLKSVYPVILWRRNYTVLSRKDNNKISSEHSDFSKVERNNGVNGEGAWLVSILDES